MATFAYCLLSFYMAHTRHAFNLALVSHFLTVSLVEESCFVAFHNVKFLVNATFQVVADGLVANIAQDRWLVEIGIILK